MESGKSGRKRKSRPRLFIDSNLFFRVYFPEDGKGKNRIVRKTLEKSFDLVHNSIVLTEAGRKRSLVQEKRRRIRLLLRGDSSVVFPNAAEWAIAFDLVVEFMKSHHAVGVEHLRKMQMDCPLAAMALNRKIALMTRDTDFTLLLRYQRKLILINPDEYFE